MGLLTIPIEETVELNHGTKTVRLDYPLIRGDNEAHEIILSLKKDGQPVDLTGVMVKCYAMLPNKVSTAIVTGTSNGNIARVTFSDTFYSQNGSLDIIVRLTKSGTSVVPLRIIATVQSGATDTIIDNDNIIPSLDDLLAQIANCIQATENANNAASNANSGESVRQNNESTRQSNESARNTKLQNLTFTVNMLNPDDVASAITVQNNDSINVTLNVPKAKQGAPNIVKGQAYTTLSALQAAVTSPAEGDQYNVGNAPPYNVFRWTGAEWEDQGQIGVTVDNITNSAIDAILEG